MEHKIMVSTYKRYKSGQDKFAKWLVKSANELLQPAARLGSCKVKVTAAQLLMCAERIVASKKPGIAIDQDMVEILRDVIIGRKKCAKYYESSVAKDETAELVASIKTHAHHVTVLEKVLNVLQTETNARCPKQRRQAVKEADETDSVANIFSLLTLVETAESSTVPSQQQQQTTRPQAKGKSKQIEELVLQTDQEDGCFSLWCLFKDVFDIRTQVRETWIRVRSGEISAMVACRLTAAATTFINARSGEYAHTLKSKRKDRDNQFPILSETYPDVFDFNKARDVRHTSLAPTADNPSDLFCAQAFFGIFSLQYAVNAIKHSSEQSEYDDIAREIAGCHYFAKILIRHARWLWTVVTESELVQAGCNSYQFACLDALTTQLVMFVHSERMQVTLIAAVQMYMDIYSVFDDSMDRIFEQIDDARAGIIESLLTVDAFIKHADEAATEDGDNELAKWLRDQIDPQTAAHVENLRARLKRTPGQKADEIVAWRIRVLESSSKSDASIPAFLELPIALLRFLFLLPAHHVDRRGTAMLSQGVGMGHYEQITLSVAFLSKAARLCGALPEAWHDLDYAIGRQNMRSKKFIREMYEKVEEVHKAFLVAGGQRLQTIAFLSGKSQMPKRLPSGRLPLNDPVHIKPMSPTVESFKESKPEEDRNPGSALAILYGCIRHHASGVKGIADPDLRAQWSDTKTLSPTQMLTVLQEAYLDEEVDFLFDYTTLSSSCITLMHTLRTKLSGVIPIQHRAVFAQGSLARFTEHLLGLSAVYDRQKKSVESWPVYQAGLIMKEEIKRFDDGLLEHAKARASKRALEEPTSEEPATHKRNQKNKAPTKPDA